MWAKRGTYSWKISDQNLLTNQQQRVNAQCVVQSVHLRVCSHEGLVCWHLNFIESIFIHVIINCLHLIRGQVENWCICFLKGRNFWGQPAQRLSLKTVLSGQIWQSLIEACYQGRCRPEGIFSCATRRASRPTPMGRWLLYVFERQRNHEIGLAWLWLSLCVCKAGMWTQTATLWPEIVIHTHMFALYFCCRIDFLEQLWSIIQQGLDVWTWYYLSGTTAVIHH